MKLGSNSISKLYIGTNAVSKVYLGSNVVYSASSNSFVDKGFPANPVLFLHAGYNTRSGYNAASAKWEDLSGNNLDCTWSATPPVASAVDGYYFNGSTGVFGTIANNTLLNNFGNKLTFIGGLKALTGGGNNQNMLCKPNAYLLGRSQDYWVRFRFDLYIGSPKAFYKPFGSSIDNNAFIAHTYDGSYRTSYLNASVVDVPGAQTGNITTNNNNIFVGDLNGTGNYPFYGYMHYIAVYNRVLTQDELNAVQAAGFTW